ncbi:MAG: ABC transporter ATP-binding protein [Clostridia bacterium]|nr:ABC transporter ATP-binding protein [Clostridia bacterium]
MVKTESAGPAQRSYFNDREIHEESENFLKVYAKNKDHALKILFGLYKGYRGKILLSVLCCIVKTSPMWLLPLVTANIIDLVVERPADSTARLLLNLAVAVISLLLNIPFHVLHVKYFSIARRSMEAGLRGAMVRKLQRLSISFHKEMQSGKIQSKVMRDVEAVESLSSQLFGTMVEMAFNILVTVVILLQKNITVFLLFLLTIPMALLVMEFFRTHIRNNNREFRREIENTASQVLDMVELVPVTRAHALENNEIQKLTDRVTNVATKGYRLDMVQAWFGSIHWVTFYLFQTVCLAVSAYFALKGKISVGDVALYQSYFASLVQKVSAILGLLPVITKGTESVRSIGEILNSYNVEEYTGQEKLQPLAGEYEFRHLYFRYPDNDRLVLKDLNLTVRAGETIALVGESGSGKSTLVNMAIGFFKPDAGEIIIDGHGIEEINIHDYRRQIAVVPQNTILFNGSIRDNITYGLETVSEEKINEAIRAANLTRVIEGLPDGLDTQIGEHGDKLSGGQRQRISIARAIIRDPRVIIFDEATSALDSVSEAEIQSAINNLTENRTTFIVAHRLSTIRDADKIAVMQNGECVEYGTYEELMARKGAFYTYKIAQS